MDKNWFNRKIKKNTSALRQDATDVFNKYIRLRDSKNGIGRCISCGKILKVPDPHSHAGHYYSAGQHPSLRYDEMNVHLQCLQCNYFLSGNLIKYRQGLILKHGNDYVEKLDRKYELSKLTPFVWDKLELIAIIDEYRKKIKSL